MAPAELREVIELQLRVSRTYLRFPLHYATHEHRTGAPVFTDNRVEVTALALDHRLECTGYLFREAPLPPASCGVTSWSRSHCMRARL
jgi:ribonuclease Z